MNAPSLSVIVPAYNERPRLAAALDAIRGCLEARDTLEIIVVDDGSDDGSASFVSAYAARHPAVRLVRLPRNLGKGAAVRAGVLASRGELICFCDADLAIPASELVAVADALRRGAAVAIASRALPASRIIRPPSLPRRIMSRAFNLAVRVMFKLPFGDTQCGCKGFQRAAALDLFAQAQIDGFAFDVELLVLARQCGYAVVEVPVQVEHGGASTVSLASHARRIWRDLRRIRRWLMRGEYAVRVHDRAAALTQRQRLSIVILAKNEEPRIGRCLESVSWADEIVVIDGMSTDRTVEICERFGARVVRHAFDGSFAQERNLGIEQATGDWVLQIDADDVVTPAFRAAVERALADPQPYDALKFRRKSYLMGRFMRHGGWHHYLPNLIRRERVRYVGDVHERPVVPGAIGVLEADIEHHPCEDLAAFINRHNRYTSIQAGELVKTGAAADAVARLERDLIRKPWKTFWKSYVKKQGWREGMHGLVFGLLFAWIELLKWAKCWERTHAAPPAANQP